ncbi:GNAT family N-acetyltransferase [Bacillus pseudomycoides]|uniref:GNAT family N-acetyltransferase n=1 Tax=Bacillus pseudomycoides TaxID=64104 RepID=A0AA91VAG5_9BACI|nr:MULTISPECIES: N-acetyltransferase [Bacillus]PEB56505.1 GNAT family N-acetyltransferase [Bacillus sp. AFS098217]PED81502.1 GNAT family N-acetyltransferase [Bacillus pseudomycoides]PEU09393.1 GNAT family N-acetyltransferase [Bacillus sp. AFS019443]PEU12538.1 GNAT family N-acetyltransferase [Bacillus sp. AFS014408]PFW61817.1 GNAT family N-acetyltransferase [Bacillus sp. AFS075034]
MQISNAITSDVKEIYNLIETYSKKGVVLPRSLLSLYQYLQCLYVVKEGEEIFGVAGLHVLGEDLAEIRSLVVPDTYTGKGIGRMLVNHVISEASKIKVRRVISLTYQTTFFQKCGFDFVDKESLPEKVWVDCRHCPKFDCCDEVAMVRYVT